MVYQYNGVDELLVEQLHGQVDHSRGDPGYSTVLFEDFKRNIAKRDAPLFQMDSKEDNEKRFLGTMHLSSASFRLTTALYLTTKNTESMPLKDYLKDRKVGKKIEKAVDWNRKDLYPHLIEAAGAESEFTGCVKRFNTDKDADKGLLPTYLAMIVAHSDEFRHGEGIQEDSKKEGTWIGEREKCYSKFCWCSIVKAQLRLLRAATYHLKDL